MQNLNLDFHFLKAKKKNFENTRQHGLPDLLGKFHRNCCKVKDYKYWQEKGWQTWPTAQIHDLRKNLLLAQKHKILL